MELQRRVAEAVLALAEPYRSTLLAHCLDGRTTKQIAEQTGEPWATVRSRLARGIEQLRASLRTEHEDWRDRMAYAVFGVPSLRLARAPGAAGVAAGVAALVLASAAAVSVWLWATAPDLALQKADPAVVAAAPAAERPTASERTASAPPAVSEPADPAPAARTVAYAGQLLDPRGEPLAGVGVFVGERHIATTDDAGRFHADLPAGEHVVATDEQHCLLFSAPLREGAPNRFLATRRIRLLGTVVDETGQRVNGARIVYHPGTPVDYPHSLHGLEPSEAPPQIDVPAGEFDFLVPWLEGAHLSAQAAGHLDGMTITFCSGDGPGWVISVLGEGQPRKSTEPQQVAAFRAQVDACFVLPRRPTAPGAAWPRWLIEGLVLDSEGRPVAGASVGYSFLRVSSRADGTFTIDTASGNLWADALVAEHAELGVAAVTGVEERWKHETGMNPHETLRLARATSTLRGRVVDARGEPVAGRSVRVVDPWVSVHGGRLRIHEENAFSVGAVSDSNGAFELKDLLPRAHRLTALDPVTMEGAVFGPFADAAADVVLTVDAGANLQPEWRGLVIDVAGRPIPGATVRVMRWSELGGLGNGVLHKVTFTAGPDGRVVVPAQCSDAVNVAIEAPGYIAEVRSRDQLHEPAVQLGRVAYLRYLGRRAPESNNQLRLEVRDAQDRPLIVEGPYAGDWMRSSMYWLSGTKSPVLAVSELATTLVIYSDDGSQHRNEPHRYPIRLVAGEVTTID
jgi:protocatechuate 3,4-dioxygenase beta subunit